MKRLLVLSLLVAAIGIVDAQEKSAYTSDENIAYRRSADNIYADSICRLDIIYPVNKPGFSTLIWFHGGGLTGGSRIKTDGEIFEKGFAVVRVDYRLSPKASVDECIDDAAAATAWVMENIERYGGDPKRIFVAGHSAGAYLTCMIGLDKQYLARYGIDPDTAFVRMIPYSPQAITHFVRRAELGMKQTQPLIDPMAPLFHVRADCAPMTIILGDRQLEMLGRYEENAYMWRMFQVVGHPDVTILELDGFTHGSMQRPGHLITSKIINNYDKERQKASRNNGK